MTENKHVQKHHLERKAFLYVRQSSMKQVLENVESTKRQYALKARAIALGWPDERVVVAKYELVETEMLDLSGGYWLRHGSHPRAKWRHHCP